MAIDAVHVAKRVGQILNAATRDVSGNITFVTTVEDSRRNATNIAAAVDEAVLEVARARCESDANPGRTGFVLLVTVTHGAASLPFHYGPPGRPQIQLYSGGPWVAGVQRPASEIESFRSNPEQIYDAIDHDAEGSTLSGFYDFVGDGIVFTGFACQVPLAQFTNAGDAALKLPAGDEAAVVRVAVGLCKTEGDSGVLDQYAQQGQADLQQIRAGAATIQPIEMAEKAA